MARKRQQGPVQGAQPMPAAKASKNKPAAQPVPTGKPSKNKAPAQPGIDDPLAVLRYEHRTLDSLFAQFALRKDQQLAQRVCASLTSHFKLEQDFYREAETIPELHGRVDVAQREHGGMEDRIRAIASLDEGDELTDQMVELRRAVEQHVREEERAIFPAVVKTLSRQRLQELGVHLRAARDKLLENGEQ